METEKKQSGLGIAGMIIGIVSLVVSCIAIGGFTGIIGLILSCIAISQKDKKHGMAIAGIILNILAILIFVIMLCIVTKEDSSNSAQEPEVAKPAKEVVKYVDPEPAPIVKEVATDDGIIDTSADGCSLKYLRHEMKTDAAGNDCIAVFYEFTNNSDETTSYAYTFSTKAFQNGIELDTSIFLMEDIEDNRYKDIRPGISVEVYSLFKPQDDSVVELEVAKWISLSDKPLDSMMLSLQ